MEEEWGELENLDWESKGPGVTVGEICARANGLEKLAEAETSPFILKLQVYRLLMSVAGSLNSIKWVKFTIITKQSKKDVNRGESNTTVL